MADRQERRTQFAGIDLRTTERFGSLCSPFQALHVQVRYTEQNGLIIKETCGGTCQLLVIVPCAEDGGH